MLKVPGDNRASRLLNWVLQFCIDQWFFIGLGVFVALAHSYPNVAKHGGHIRLEYTIGYLAVAIIFFGSGLSMSTRLLMKNMGHWRVHFTVLSLSFLITSSIIYGICCGIRKLHNKEIDDWMLVGLIVTATCPTTVLSNVVMTKKADGNDLLTLCEVFIGNLLGLFITPALTQMFLSGSWEFANPANGSSVQDVYKDVMKQIGCSVFVPLFIGQILQNIFPTQVKYFYTKTKFNKVGSFMLLLIMWSSFSTAFLQHAFTSVPTGSIIFIVFFNIGIYMFFTVICYLYSRPAFLLNIFLEEPTAESSKWYTYSYKTFRPFYYNRRDTVAVMLCGGAKTAALGVSLISAQYGSDSPDLGRLLVPLVLYQSEQVLCAGVLTGFMKKWIHAGPEYKQEQLEKKLKEQEEEKESEDGDESGSNDQEEFKAESEVTA